MTLRCDLIIRDATVIDGTGAPRVGAPMSAVRGDRIAGVGDLGGWSAADARCDADRQGARARLHRRAHA